MYDYERIRPILKSGDLILFQRIPWRWSYLHPRNWSDLGGFLSNILISTCQYWSLPGYDGFWQFVHCGVVVRWENDDDDPTRPDDVLLAEVMAMGSIPDLKEAKRRQGLTVCKLSERIREYRKRGGHAAVIPLRECRSASPEEEERLFDSTEKTLIEFRKLTYNYGGLIFAILQRWFGWAVPGKMFCSEAVVHFWLETGLLPPESKIRVRNEFIKFPVQPQAYSPLRVSRMHEIIDQQEAMFLEYLVES